MIEFNKKYLKVINRECVLEIIKHNLMFIMDLNLIIF
jgi:hypothetical protein